ncbi:MAG: energy-coupling factor transporter transmembrane component T family protein [Anaeroplasmataceae bacterium]
MLDNITLGQYIPGNSWIYKMDPRMKIILVFLMMVIIFVLPTLLSITIALGVVFLLIISSRVPLMKVIKGLKPIVYLVLFTFVLQVIYTKTGDLKATLNFSFNFYTMLMIIGIILFYFLTKKYIPFKMIYFLVFVISLFAVQYFFHFDKFFSFDYRLKIYEGGLNKGLYVGIRVILMIIITSLLTFTTSNMDINNGISSVLSPLKVIKIPVGILSMMMSLTLRFIPTLLAETKKIMNAQSSRGVDFNEGSLKDKVTQIISLLIPMFVISFKRAEELSNAMIARGYEIDAPRTKYDLLKLKALDYISLIVVLGVLGFSIWYRVIV